jgi:hypothetical protein
MAMPRGLSLFTLTAVAAPWAVLLGVSGLWLVFSGPTVWPGAGALCVVGGVTLCMSGQLVCSVCIADRLFPRGGRAVGWLVEISSCLILFGGCFWLLWTVLGALLAPPAS